MEQEKHLNGMVERTSSDHVWRDPVTGKYHYSDEAEQIVETPYDTEFDAAEALGNYVHQLNLPRE
jgi:hypothetical protein